MSLLLSQRQKWSLTVTCSSKSVNLRKLTLNQVTHDDG